MTIHHDKMAYGKLDPLQEELSRDKLNDIADLLNAEEAAQESETAAEEGGVAARTEREKMLAGELYDPSDAELTALRTRVRKLARAFNDTDEEDEEGRQALLRAIFGSCGEDIHCEPPLRFDYGAHTTVGEHFFANFNLVVLDCAPVKIGRQCFIGPNVTIAPPCHPLLACDRNIRRAPDGYYAPAVRQHSSPGLHNSAAYVYYRRIQVQPASHAPASVYYNFVIRSVYIRPYIILAACMSNQSIGSSRS